MGFNGNAEVKEHAWFAEFDWTALQEGRMNASFLPSHDNDNYNKTHLVTDSEIEKFLRENPAEFDNGFIRHSYHRACAMIGRLISGKKYIPFYMKESQIYNEPRKHDGIHRVEPLIRRVNGLSNIQIPRGEFTITQSGILTLMGIRQNDDLDIIISSRLRDKINKGDDNFKLSNIVDVFPKDYDKFHPELLETKYWAQPWALDTTSQALREQSPPDLKLQVVRRGS